MEGPDVTRCLTLVGSDRQCRLCRLACQWKCPAVKTRMWKETANQKELGFLYWSHTIDTAITHGRTFPGVRIEYYEKGRVRNTPEGAFH